MRTQDEEEYLRDEVGEPPSTRDADKGSPARSGYAENGPGRGDLPGRGRAEGRGREDAGEGEHAERARWREDDPDERSDRFEDGDGP